MFSDGTYVRLVLAPNTRKGTVTRQTDGRYLFHHDQRFDDKITDFLVPEGDIEADRPPTDSEVTSINALIKQG
jgi:hypothetical protein